MIQFKEENQVFFRSLGWLCLKVLSNFNPFVFVEVYGVPTIRCIGQKISKGKAHPSFEHPKT